MIKHLVICVALVCCVTPLFGESLRAGGYPEFDRKPTVIFASETEFYDLVLPSQRDIFESEINALRVDPILQKELVDAAHAEIPDDPNIRVSMLNGEGLGKDYQLGQKTVSLGIVTLGDMPANKTFTIVNTGDLPLSFPDRPSIWVSGPHAQDFTVVSPTILSSLSPGKTLSFDLRFSPLVSGDREATVHISSNDPDQALFSFSVTGTANQVPVADAGPSFTARKLDTVTLSAVGSSDPDGDSVSLSYRWDYVSGPMKTAPLFSPDANTDTVTFVPTEIGTYEFEVIVTDGMSSSTDTITVEVTTRTRLVTGSIRADSGSWSEVSLPHTYESMVVACTLQYDYDPNRPPLAARVTDAFGSSFKVRLFAADRGSAPIKNVLVHYIVVEEGSYTEPDDGIKMEARTYLSSTISGKTVMRGGTQSAYANTYSAPVVIGQVMTTNDSNYQVFWAHGQSPSTAPSPTMLKTGRHIGEDPTVKRLSETVGYIVWEAGLNSCDGTTFFAGRTSKSVTGMANSRHNQPISELVPVAAVLSSAGLNQDDGGYPVLRGEDAVGNHHVSIAIEEDTLRDSDRTHQPEGVAYVAFDSTHNAFPIADNLDIEMDADAEHTVTLTGMNLNGDETWDVITKPRHGTLTGAAPHLTYSPAIGFEGKDTFTFAISNAETTSRTATVSIHVKPVNPFMLTGVVSAQTDAWTTVALPRSFVSMVAVCTPAYDPSDSPPMIARVQNAFGNSFQVRLYRADNLSEPITDIPVHYIVLEEGHYTVAEHGAKVEARRYTCSEIFSGSQGSLAQHTTKNTYSQPVVIGQILSTNSPDFQVFWASDGSQSGPPSHDLLFTGRHLGESPKTNRSPEDIGYIIFEAGTSSLAGLSYEAGLTADTITHNPYKQSVTTVNPEVAILSTAGINGKNGCFPVLVDSVTTPGGFRLALNEDVLTDGERSHPTEQVAYVAFKASPSTRAYAVNQTLHLETPGEGRMGKPLDVALKALSVGPSDTWSIITQPSKGRLTGTAPSLSYEPNPGFNGADAFSFKLITPRGESNTATITIVVTPAFTNKAPVLDAVWAGPDPDNLTSPALLEVSAWDPDDDALSHRWECVDGPGEVTFKPMPFSPKLTQHSPVRGNAHTQASFSESGDYTLKVTTSDSKNKPKVSYLSVNVTTTPHKTVFVPTMRDAAGSRDYRLLLIPIVLLTLGGTAIVMIRMRLKNRTTLIQ